MTELETRLLITIDHFVRVFSFCGVKLLVI